MLFPKTQSQTTRKLPWIDLRPLESTTSFPDDANDLMKLLYMEFEEVTIMHTMSLRKAHNTIDHTRHGNERFSTANCRADLGLNGILSFLVSVSSGIVRLKGSMWTAFIR